MKINENKNDYYDHQFAVIESPYSLFSKLNYLIHLEVELFEAGFHWMVMERIVEDIQAIEMTVVRNLQ